MMFWLFNEHHVLPEKYYRMPEGEKVLLRLMFESTMSACSSK